MQSEKINIFSIDGIMGAGKTTFGEDLKEYFKNKGEKTLNFIQEDSFNEKEINKVFKENAIEEKEENYKKIQESFITKFNERYSAINENKGNILTKIFNFKEKITLFDRNHISIDIFSKTFLFLKKIGMETYSDLIKKNDEINDTFYSVKKIIFIEIDEKTAYENIKKRGREFESNIDLNFLKELKENTRQHYFSYIDYMAYIKPNETPFIRLYYFDKNENKEEYENNLKKAYLFLTEEN